MLRPTLLPLLALASNLRAQAVHRITDTPKPEPQRAAEQGVLAGTVFDSLRSLPLAGATVVISGTPYATTTDIGGRFRFVIDSLPEGRHTLGFFHPTLDSLGITPPTRDVEIRHGQSLLVQLAVPSTTTILQAICPANTRTDGRGLVMGVVRDAETERPLPGARVVLLWTGTSVANNAVIKVPQATSAVVNADGSYRACGVPPDTRITAQARLSARASGWIELTLPPGTLLIRNFLLGARDTTQVASGAPAAPSPGAPATPAAPPDSAAAPALPRAAPLGKAVLTGTVVAADGKPLEGAQIMLLGTALGARTDAKGAFRLAGLPAGTHSIEVRRIGYAPRRYVVDLSAVRESRVAAVLDERATVLNPVTVAARNKSADLTGFEQRRARGLGAYLTREDIEKRGSYLMTDLFRALPGVQVLFVGNEYIVQMARANTGSYCPVEYYIDGAPFLANAEDIDKVLRPDDIEAIEVYKSATETPVQFQKNGGACGVIVIWTRRSAGRK